MLLCCDSTNGGSELKRNAAEDLFQLKGTSPALAGREPTSVLSELC